MDYIFISIQWGEGANLENYIFLEFTELFFKGER
jgi:hypothetical protein